MIQLKQFRKNEEETKSDKDKPKEILSRFTFAKIIAEAWFNIIDEIPNIEELKNDLKDNTLIGEYCGNQKYQHLVKYNEIMIYFYALVDNYGNKKDERHCGKTSTF